MAKTKGAMTINKEEQLRWEFDNMTNMLPLWATWKIEQQKYNAHKIYVAVYRSWKIPLDGGYTSLNACLSKNPKSECTDDHVFSGQLVVQFLMDHPHLWRGNFEKFLELMKWGASTIKVTKNENARLSHKTYKVPTVEKYSFLNIALVKDGFGPMDKFPVETMPEGWTRWEKRLIEMHS